MRLYYPNSSTLATKLTAALKDTLTVPTAKTESITLASTMEITPDAADNIFLLLDYTPSRSAAITVASGGTALTMVEYRAGVTLANGQAAIDFDNSVLALNVWHKTNNKVISVTYTGVKTELDLCTLKTLLEHLINTENPHGDTLSNITGGKWLVNADGTLSNTQNNTNFMQDGHAYIQFLQGQEYFGKLTGTWDGMEKSTVSGHIANTSNPHAVTLAQLTGTTFSYAYGEIFDRGGGYWNGGDSSAAFDILEAFRAISLGGNLFHRNASAPTTTYCDIVCNSGGLPEYSKKSPTDSVPVNIGSPYFTGTHWGVASNTPVSTVKYDGTNPCGGTFRKFNQITSGELQFGANTNNRLFMPSSSSLAVGQRYIATCIFRSVAINGQTPPSCNYRLYLTIPTGGTLYVMTYSNVTPPAYNADGNSQLLSMEGVIDVLGVDANNLMFCMSSATCSTLVQPTKYVSKTYSDINKPYFSLWASDASLNTTWECYLADMSLYRIK